MKNDIEIKLVCTKCDESLPDFRDLEERQEVVCSKCGHIIKTKKFDDSLLLDFSPEETLEAGATEDKKTPYSYENAQPDGKTYPRNYVIDAIRKHVAGEVLVDIGCRNCEITRYFVGSSFCIGVDISASAMFENIPNVLNSKVPLLIVADATHKLPLQDESVDTIICLNVLEHLMRPKDLCAEVRRCLKPGGKFICTVPNLTHIGNRLSILFGSGAGLEFVQMLKGKSPVIPYSGVRFPDQKMHIRFFTNKSLCKFLQDCGFTVEKKFGLGPVVTRLGLSGLLYNWSLLTGCISYKS